MYPLRRNVISSFAIFIAVLILLLPWSANASSYAGCTGEGAVYRFKVGRFIATILSDGDLVMRDNPFDTPLVAVHRSYRNLSLSTLPYRFPQNGILLQKDGENVLVDTGLGSYTGHGTRAGKIVANLAKFGVTPDQVNYVIITHGHFDHVGGLVTGKDESKRTFPNAKIYISEREYRWWMEEAKVIPDPVPDVPDVIPTTSLGTTVRVGAETPVTKTLLREFKRSLIPYPNSSIVLVSGGHIPIEGIMFMSTPGHTPGHMSVIVRSFGESLFIAGDMVIGEASNLVHPEWAMNIEQDESMAIATRFKILDMLSSTRILTLLYHEAFPGLGTVSKLGATTFKWTPTEDSASIVERCRGYQLDNSTIG